MPSNLYDTLKPPIDWIPNYSGPMVESELDSFAQSRVADASAIFGQNSMVDTGQSNMADLFSTSLSHYASLTDNIIFKAAVIALFIYYCYVVFHFRDCIATLFKIIKVKSDGSNLLNDSTYIFSLFLRTMTAMWCAVIAIVLVKFADIYAADQIGSSIPQWAVALLIVPAMTTIPLVMLYQKAIIRLIDNVTLNSAFTGLISYVKVLFTALGVLTIAPTILLLALYNGPLQNILLYTVAAEVIMITSLWLYKTYVLFIEQNVSILYWILYLCAIEIFPFTLLILIALQFA